MGSVAGSHRRLGRTTEALLVLLRAVDQNTNAGYERVWASLCQWIVTTEIRAEYGAYWSSDRGE